MIDYDLQKLRNTTEEIIRSIDSRIDGANNWGDLHCMFAERYETSDNNIGFRVWIEEASPDAYELQKYIIEKLKEKGVDGVEVMTEW